MIDIIVVGIIAISLGLIAYTGIKKAKSGESSSCGCSCNGCPSQSCASKQE